MLLSGETIASLLVAGFVGYVVKYLLDLKLAKQSEAMIRKRLVYEQIATALGIFISGRRATTEDKNKFLEESSRLWLWASDSVVQALNDFLDILIEIELTKSSSKDCKEKANQAYANFVIEMRKGLGFRKTSLKSGDYRFVSFGD